MSFQPKALVALLSSQLVLAGEVAFGKTEVMNGVEQIGFANAVFAANAYNPFCELKFLVKIIFELEQ